MQAIHALTNGRGADVCVDAVGMEAKRNLLGKLSNLVHAQAGRHQSAQTAISAVRRGRVVTMVGVYGMPYDNFSLGQIFDKGIARIRSGARAEIFDELQSSGRGGGHSCR